MPSFDIVSEVNQVEVRNALDQANKELGTRFDFKGSDARVEYDGKALTLYRRRRLQAEAGHRHRRRASSPSARSTSARSSTATRKRFPATR